MIFKIFTVNGFLKYSISLGFLFQSYEKQMQEWWNSVIHETTGRSRLVFFEWNRPRQVHVTTSRSRFSKFCKVGLPFSGFCPIF